MNDNEKRLVLGASANRYQRENSMYISDNAMKVVKVSSFQDEDSGQPKNMVRLDYFGGSINVMLTPEEAKAVTPYVGKMVGAVIPCQIVRKADGLMIKFDPGIQLTEIKSK